MNLLIRAITWQERDTCEVAIFDSVANQTQSATFHLVRSPVGVGARTDSNALATTDAAADDVRSLVALVVAFCQAAQGEDWRAK
jgi:hypothetical protein